MFISDSVLEAIVLANCFHRQKKKSLPEEKMRKGPLCHPCVCVKAQHLRPENMQRCVFEVRSHVSGQGFRFLLPWISRTVSAACAQLALTA